MRGLVSFHAVDVEFFDSVIGALIAGDKINPESYLEAATRLRANAWQTEAHKRALEFLAGELEPPPPPEDGTLWDRVRTRLERFDHKPSALVRLVAAKIDPDLHLYGRPFFITEGSAERVAKLADEYGKASGTTAVDALILEQLARLDPDLAKGVRPEEIGEPSPDGTYRSDLLRQLKRLYDLGCAARGGQEWGRQGGDRAPAAEVIERDLPWLALDLHARAVPFWIGRDVDGLEGIAQAAGAPPPDVLVPPRRLFATVSEPFPGLREQLGVELQAPRSLGGFVAPSDVEDLLDYLNAHGSRMIQIASRHGEGPVVTTLLRKIRECASFAARRGLGYLEACGIAPPGWEDPETPPGSRDPL